VLGLVAVIAYNVSKVLGYSTVTLEAVFILALVLYAFGVSKQSEQTLLFAMRKA